jgi:hypothetical protein
MRATIAAGAMCLMACGGVYAAQERVEATEAGPDALEAHDASPGILEAMATDVAEAQAPEAGPSCPALHEACGPAADGKACCPGFVCETWSVCGEPKDGGEQ